MGRRTVSDETDVKECVHKERVRGVVEISRKRRLRCERRRI